MTTRTIRTTTASTFAAVALLVAGCSGGADESEAPTEPPPIDTAVESTVEPEPEPDAADTFRIGLVAPSAEDDRAWTQSMVDALDRVAADRDVEVSVSSGLASADDAAVELRSYAEDDLDLVIAHGTQYTGVLREVAAEFPEVAFALGTSTDAVDLPNVFAYAAAAEQGGYVNGVIAAQLTTSGRIGVVGPVEAGDAALYVAGFVAGVAAENPAVVVDVNYIESFTDVVLAAEAAAAHVAAGADVLTGTSQMVIGAAGVAADASIPWLGTQADQTPLGPDVVVASQVYRWDAVLTAMIDRVRSETLGGEPLVASFADGGLEMLVNDAVELAPEVRARADDAVAGILDGSVVVPRTR